MCNHPEESIFRGRLYKVCMDCGEILQKHVKVCDMCSEELHYTSFHNEDDDTCTGCKSNQ